MTFNYSGLNETAERLIERFGRTATLTQTANTGTEYNPTRTETDHTVKIAVFDFKNSEVDGTLIETGDKKIYLSTEDLTVVPSVHDKLTIDGDDHAILDVKTLKPGLNTLVYILQVRR